MKILIKKLIMVSIEKDDNTIVDNELIRRISLFEEKLQTLKVILRTLHTEDDLVDRDNCVKRWNLSVIVFFQIVNFTGNFNMQFRKIDACTIQQVSEIFTVIDIHQ